MIAALFHNYPQEHPRRGNSAATPDAQGIANGMTPHFLVVAVRIAPPTRTFTRPSSVTGAATRPDPEATRLNRGVVIFYRAFGTVKDKPLAATMPHPC
ncbi:MAG TPA: hypothetical protein VMA30_00160 [Xanthobacteraceae bacterium]|nr:hypothetical protein [Xanthobacteraceae bacterium]